MPTPLQAERDQKKFGGFVAQQMLVIRNPKNPAPILIHSERNRCVFSQGEEIRFFVSARYVRGMKADVELRLQPLPSGTALGLGRFPVEAPAGQERSLVLDLPAEQSQSLAPGNYALEAYIGDRKLDRFEIQIVSPEPSSGGGRWAHTMPYGYGGGITSRSVMPWSLEHRRSRIERIEKGIHQASFWNNFYTANMPVRGPQPQFPEADAPDLPPVSAMGRPALPHAFFQELMSQGIAFGLTPGYGEDYKAEVYMPIPTVVEDQMRQMGRKYLNVAQGASQHPNFVALYTDFYGHMDFMGAGEIASEQLNEIRERLWKEGTEAAGMRGASKPRKYPTSRKELPKDQQALLKDKTKSKAWDAYWREQGERYKADGKKWFGKRTLREQQQLWAGGWKAAGLSAPAAPEYIPKPELSSHRKESLKGDENYLYASHLLRGIERAYGTFTSMVEEEFPSVFTIHNRLGMNHSKVGHAWTGIRTPNVDPAYTQGASAVSVSEWNLDSVPKPYLLPTFYNRTLVDNGMAVYRAGLWKQMGMPSRFMRDSVMWGGRQIQTYFDQTSNMTWSHKGADQTTYAANERMRSVSEFLVTYSDLFNKLEPVREVGLYVGPYGGPWGTGVTRGHFIALLTALMADHQVHMVSHGDLDDGVFSKYPIVYAPGFHGPDFYPFEKKAFQQYVKQGGEVVGAPPPNYYHPEEVWKGKGISNKQVPVLDDKGNPRKNKDGSPRMKTEWKEDFATWAKIDRKYIWGWLDRNVRVAPIDIHTTYTHLEKGKPATWKGSHWTGHHNWAKYRGPSLAQFKKLAGVFEPLHEPMVKKDQPELFVNINKPEEEGAEGFFLFASNWTLPTQEELYQFRVPQGFFNSGVQPIRSTLRVKDENIGAVYDVISAQEVPIRKEAGRVVFEANLDSVEGRVYALYPQKVASARLRLPESLRAGDRLQARFELLNAAGSPMKVLGSVRVRLQDAEGKLLSEVHRALPASGRLPDLALPATSPLTLEVTDTITGQQVLTTLELQAPGALRLQEASPVTLYRPDQISEWLNTHKSGITILVDDGRFQFSKNADEAPKLSTPNPNLERDTQMARALQQLLGKSGISAEIKRSGALLKGQLPAHPWTGKMANYRNKHVVPNYHIPGAVLMLGSESTPLLQEMERAGVAPRQWAGAPSRNGRAVLAWMPQVLDQTDSALALVTSDPEGLKKAAEALVALRKGNVSPDRFYAAREQVRLRWTPSEVQEHKERKLGLRLPEQSAVSFSREIPATQRWQGMTEILGTAVFDIHASEGGVAVGTKSWVKPVGSLSPDGQVQPFFGGGNQVTPRDVGISNDGKTVAAGFSLMGRAALWHNGQAKLNKASAMTYKSDNPFSWDSFKDTDRQLGVSPNGDLFVFNVGPEGILAVGADGRERWRISNQPTESRPRGNASAEFGFSPDGNYVLLNAQRVNKNMEMDLTVSKMRKDSKGRWNKKDQYKTTERVRADVYIEEVMLVDARSGKPKWKILTDVEVMHPKEGYRIWGPGKETEFRETIDGKVMKWKSKTPPALLKDREGLMSKRVNLNMWHLYSAVGPNGRWAITGTRDAQFNLHDENGNILRLFRPVDLPKALDPGQQIPLQVVTGNDPNRLVLYAPQSKKIFLYRLKIGSKAERDRARRLQEENAQVISTIQSELKNTKNYGNYGKEDYIQAFGRKISAVPSDLHKELLDKMRRIPAERRAKRKRDYRFFEGLVGDIRLRMIEEDRAAVDAAVGLIPENTVDLPDLICDVEVDPELRVAYVGLWDGTVRAIDLRSGNIQWTAELTGGSQIALARDRSGKVVALYAGGSRGDVTRLDPKDGAVKWSRNITRETNQL